MTQLNIAAGAIGRYAGLAAGHTVNALCRLPRPLRELDDETLEQQLITMMTLSVTSVYQASTGKSIRLGLDDQELSQVRRRLNAVGLVISVPAFLVLTHEAVMRRLEAC